jgi:hypothetical protein
MSKKTFSSIIALAALAAVTTPIGLNTAQDTSIPVVQGETHDCALNGDDKLKCWTGTFVHSGKSFDCRFNGEAVFCKEAVPKV